MRLAFFVENETLFSKTLAGYGVPSVAFYRAFDKEYGTFRAPLNHNEANSFSCQKAMRLLVKLLVLFDVLLDTDFDDRLDTVLPLAATLDVATLYISCGSTYIYLYMPVA